MFKITTQKNFNCQLKSDFCEIFVWGGAISRKTFKFKFKNSSFGKLRKVNDLFDVTLACEDGWWWGTQSLFEILMVVMMTMMMLQLTQLLGLKMHTLPNLGDAVIASSERLIRLHCWWWKERDYHDDGDDKDIKDQLNILALPTDMIFVTSSTSSASVKYFWIWR